MDNEKAVEGLVSEMISPLIERVVTKKLTQILDVTVKHEREKLAAAKARIAELEKGLEPFAREGSQWGNVGSHKQVAMHVDNGDGSHSVELLHFTGDDLRRAAALLKEKE